MNGPWPWTYPWAPPHWQTPYVVTPCAHCYCQTLHIGGKPHKVCCMCGDRKLTTHWGYSEAIERLAE